MGNPSHGCGWADQSIFGSDGICLVKQNVARPHLREKSLLDNIEQIAIDQLNLSEVRHERSIADLDIGKFFCRRGIPLPHGRLPPAGRRAAAWLNLSRR
jgi:hypothetical protein